MKRIEAHIRIEQHPNPAYRTYHLSRLVSQAHMFGFGIDRLFSSLGQEKKPGELAEKLAARLGKLPGVSEGHFNAYEVSIKKGAALEWADVSPLVVGQIVKHVFPECIGKTIEVSTTLHYMAGEYSRHEDCAKRFKVPVKFIAKKRPWVDVEWLFNPQSLRKVVDNDAKPVTKVPASSKNAANDH